MVGYKIIICFEWKIVCILLPSQAHTNKPHMYNNNNNSSNAFNRYNYTISEKLLEMKNSNNG